MNNVYIYIYVCACLCARNRVLILHSSCQSAPNPMPTCLNQVAAIEVQCQVGSLSTWLKGERDHILANIGESSGKHGQWNGHYLVGCIVSFEQLGII